MEFSNRLVSLKVNYSMMCIKTLTLLMIIIFIDVIRHKHTKRNLKRRVNFSYRSICEFVNYSNKMEHRQIVKGSFGNCYRGNETHGWYAGSNASIGKLIEVSHLGSNTFFTLKKNNLLGACAYRIQ